MQPYLNHVQSSVRNGSGCRQRQSIIGYPEGSHCQDRERDDGRGDYEIPIWKHFSIEWSHMQVLYWSSFLSCISQAILRICFYIFRLRFIGQIFFLLSQASNWADFHSLHHQKSGILMDAFLASWWFNLAYIWLASELLNTSCSSLQNGNADQSWTISVGRLQILFEVGTIWQLCCFMDIECLWAVCHRKCGVVQGSPAWWRQIGKSI